MNRELRGPDDRYAVTVDALSSPDGTAFVRQQATTGVPRDWPDTGRPEFLVVVGDACELVLNLGEQGLAVRSVKLRRASRAIISLLISGCDDDARPESRVQIFDGDREAAEGYRERFIPVNGGGAAPTPAPEEAAQPEAAADSGTPLDRLALAVGRSVARANAALARMTAEGGVALVSSVTIRVGVEQAAVDGGRVTLSLARPGQESGQFVEFTMTTVPGAQPAEAEEPAMPAAPGAGVDDGSGVIRVPARGTSRSGR